MLKLILYVIIFAVIIGGGIGLYHLYSVSVRNKNEMARFQGAPVAYQNDLGKVLVVYYSLSGHTKQIADKIAALTHADIYEIKTAEVLPGTPKLHFMVKEQLKSKKYPPIRQPLPIFEQYDTIFVGGPVWWYTAATPVLSFLQLADFEGKKVVPFSTQGSNVGRYFEDFKAMAQNAQLLKGQSFNNLPAKYAEAVDNKIKVWLNGLK